jgi:hypothetical protein
MLILGYKGGMRYEEARRFTINKFGIEKSLDLEYRPNRANTWDDKRQRSTIQNTFQICDGQNLAAEALSNKMQVVSESQGVFPTEVMKTQELEESNKDINEKVFLAKQKYVYGANRLEEEDDEADSEEDEFILSLMKT